MRRRLFWTVALLSSLCAAQMPPDFQFDPEELARRLKEEGIGGEKPEKKEDGYTRMGIEGGPRANIEFETVPLKKPSVPTPRSTYLLETFQDDLSSWSKLKSDKFGGVWELGNRQNQWIEGDVGLRMTSSNAYHGLARELDHTFDVKNTSDEGIFATMELQQERPVICGGAYFKLFHTSQTRDNDVASFDEHTPYSIMFGPDRCGYMTNKVHFIVKYPTPDGAKSEEEYHEAHLDSSQKLPEGEASHQYGFALYKNGHMKLYMDGVEIRTGPLRTMFRKESWNNAEEIDDPDDVKPDDWVDDPMIEDPEAVKPEDWDDTAPEFIVDEDAVMPEGWKEDEPLYIENPNAEKPEDWNDEEDGEWVAPKMRNPDCYVGCGPWTAPMKPNPDYKGLWEMPMIENPDYKGEWSPRKIPNPDYWKIENPIDVIQPFNAIGFELWTVNPGSMIDNIFITTNEEEFERFIKETYEYKAGIEARNIERQREAEKNGPDFSLDQDTKATISKHTYSSTSMAIIAALVVVPAGLLYTLRRRRQVTTPTEDSAASKKDDDKPSKSKSGKEQKSSTGSESESASVPTSATERPTAQMRSTKKNTVGSED